jgi:hypothetical protein
MKLESAQSLKAQLLQDIVVEPVEGRSARSAGVVAFSMRGARGAGTLLGVGARTVGSVSDHPRTLALGIAPYGKEYRLAVRLQRTALLGSPLVEHLRRSAKGEIDLRVVGRVDKRATARRVAAVAAQSTRPWYQRNTRPLQIGASVAHHAVTAGTIGAFVERAGRVGILSNNHVLADEDRARRDDWVLQRAPFDGGRQPRDRVARLAHWVPFRRSRANAVDAAIAFLEDGVDFDPRRLRELVNGRDRQLRGVSPDPVDAGQLVYKVGRTTGPTRGRISAFDVDALTVSFETGNLRFDNQIEIESAGPGLFSDGGDSGSLIVNRRMEAIALLFAGSESGGRNGLGLTFANPIGGVLSALRAALVLP